MPSPRDDLRDQLDAERGLSGLLAEEEEFDGRMLLRLGSWAACAVAALAIAVYAGQSSADWRREQVAAAELGRQAEQMRQLAQASQSETRRLVSAVETLGSDRDRLYARLTSLEQGLDSVTGSIARQAASPAAQPPASAPPAIQSPSTTPAAASTLLDAPAAKPEQTPAAVAEPPAEAESKTASESASLLIPDQLPAIPAARTEFGLDLGGGDSLDDLRGLWSRLLRANRALAALTPAVALREQPGGTQLRLVAGPIADAAAAAKACAALAASGRACEPAVFTGQRLTLGPPAPPPGKRSSRRKASARAAAEPQEDAAKPLLSRLGSR